MFGYELLRNKWVILAMAAGLAAILYVIIHYYDYHKPRKTKEEKPGEYETEYLTAWQAMPWGVKVTIAAIAIFAIVFSIHAIIHPNSW